MFCNSFVPLKFIYLFVNLFRINLLSETFSSFLGYEGCEKERPRERGWASFSDHMKGYTFNKTELVMHFRMIAMISDHFLKALSHRRWCCIVRDGPLFFGGGRGE